MEEDDDFGRSDEFADKLAEDYGRGFAGFVEEDAKALCATEDFAAEHLGELEIADIVGLDKMGSWEAVFGLGEPLLFLAETPEDEDAGEDGGEEDGEPCSVWDFQKRGGEKRAVHAGDDQPGQEDEVWLDAPDENGYKSDHTSVEERDEHDAHTIGITERCGVVIHSSDDNGADHEQPVSRRNVQLTVVRLGRMDDLDLWEIGQLHDLRKKLAYVSKGSNLYCN